MSDTLSQKHCVPCRGGIPPLKGLELKRLYDQLEKGYLSRLGQSKNYALDTQNRWPFRKRLHPNLIN